MVPASKKLSLFKDFWRKHNVLIGAMIAKTSAELPWEEIAYFANFISHSFISQNLRWLPRSESKQQVKYESKKMEMNYQLMLFLSVTSLWKLRWNAGIWLTSYVLGDMSRTRCALHQLKAKHTSTLTTSLHLWKRLEMTLWSYNYLCFSAFVSKQYGPKMHSYHSHNTYF